MSAFWSEVCCSVTDEEVWEGMPDALEEVDWCEDVSEENEEDVFELTESEAFVISTTVDGEVVLLLDVVLGSVEMSSISMSVFLSSDTSSYVPSEASWLTVAI